MHLIEIDFFLDSKLPTDFLISLFLYSAFPLCVVLGTLFIIRSLVARSLN